MNADDLVKRFGLLPHPEGGFFKETYRSATSIAGVAIDRDGPRATSTAIYFLVPAGKVSRLHRIKSDEVWHFYLGGPLAVVELIEGGGFRETILGHDLAKGEVVQHVVPAGRWFGAYPLPGTEYAFVGCTVAPGFEFADFEMGDAAELLKTWPRASELIAKLG